MYKCHCVYNQLDIQFHFVWFCRNSYAMFVTFNARVKKLKVRRYSCPKQVISELWGVTCHMGLHVHSVTCHPTQVYSLHVNPNQITWCSIYLPQKDRRLS